MQCQLLRTVRRLVDLGSLLPIFTTVACAGLLLPCSLTAQPARASGHSSASSSASGTTAAGAMDGDRFGTDDAHLWRGRSGESNWWWEIRFATPRRVGAILQVAGDHDFVYRHGPTRYIWQTTPDGRAWRDLRETRQQHETRSYRLHRLTRAREVLALRLSIEQADGGTPALREIELYDAPKAAVEFPDWILAVNTTHDARLPGHGQEFIPLARSCPGWSGLQAQQVWLNAFDPDFVAAEPRPLCAFLSGNFKDWCEIDRNLWRGTDRVLRREQLPIWASCGGAQGLAILAETGIAKPWDCPHCRDPRRPLLPIYSHIGHTTNRPCGDYSGCTFERGPHMIEVNGFGVVDPVFAGLPAVFKVMESHCGQIGWAPRGWKQIAAAGPGTLTQMQCLRRKDALIYAAQFHIEMAGTPEVSRQIMGNFLRLARERR